MNTFQWKNIKDGFGGFEKLAFTYVEKEYKTTSSWIQSSKTRDGNRDGYSIVVGFRPHDLHPEEWWMEAKYSTKAERVTRYRLDSTVVSAVIHGNVSQIIFVTNISINAKTMVDIRTALEQAIQCRKVSFCTKDTLEYWLKENPDIFQEYFPDTDIQTLSLSPLFLSEEIEFYSDEKMGLSVSESLQQIQIGKIYYLYFSIYSNCEQTLKLSVGKDFKHIKIVSSKKLALSAGITPCTVKLRLENTYTMKEKTPDGSVFSRKDLLNGVILKANSLELRTKYRISVVESSESIITIPSQEKNFKTLKKQYNAVITKRKSSINIIMGSSGSGKTYLMERFVREVIDLGQSVLRITFTNHDISNDERIYQLLIYCLYPYLPPDLVDGEYLQDIQDPLLKNSVLYHAASLIKKPDCLHACFTQMIDKDIFPSQLHLNPRIILLDDLQKLNEDSLQFLFRAIEELLQKEQPIFILANTWSASIQDAAYQNISKYAIFNLLSSQLSVEDFIQVMEESGYLDFVPDYKIFQKAIPNIIALLSFLKNTKKFTACSLDELLAGIHLFFTSGGVDESILSRFRHVFEVDNEAEKLCTNIYWSVDGVSLTDDNRTTAFKLLQHELIKLNDTNTKLIPYHEWYQEIFCKRFKVPMDTIDAQNNDIYTNIITTLSRTLNPNEIAEIIAQVYQWKDEGRYYAILYVLKESFEKKEQELFQKTIGDIAYFKLYFCYGYSVANSSRFKSGKTVFEDIVQKTEAETEPDILLIRMDALFEVINSNYEWLNHDAAKKNICKIYKLIHSLQNFCLLPKDICKCDKYILTQQIEMLIHSEEESEDAEELFQVLDKTTETYHYKYEREFFRLRYAESLYFRDTTRAAAMVESCRDTLLKLRGPKDKFYLWADMDHAFLHFVLKKPESNLQAMLNAHNALKENCFNDYRKRIFALASIYYANGLKPQGDKILFSDIVTIRELRPRQKAIYFETLALHYALSNNIEEAIEQLKKAAQIFYQFPSYLKVIHHNIDILQRKIFCAEHLEFCVNEHCPKDCYCIDTRCIW